MFSLIQFIYRISRPRFFGYLAGPYAIGYIAGASSQKELVNPFFLYHLFYFLSIANILLYGINDYFDRDTDNYNKKKTIQEYKLQTDDKKKVKGILFVAIVISVITLLIQQTLLSQILFLCFLLLAILYSAPPLRFKAIPFIDSSSNILYAIPGLLAYAQITGDLPSMSIMVASYCWTFAMHLFSAVPDISADKKAGLTTTAVLLGYKKSLLLCAFVWAISAAIAIANPFLYPWSLLGIIYPCIPLYVLLKKSSVEHMYWRFPYITMMLGMLLFFLFFFAKPYA